MAKKKSVRKTESNNKPPARKKADYGPAPAPTSAKVVPNFPPNQVGLSTDHFVIHSNGPDFHLYFFQVQPPLIYGGTEQERLQEVQRCQQDGVPAICLAHIIIAAQRMPDFLKVMQSHYERSKSPGETQGGPNERIRTAV
jgi:hypothetical protein